MASKQRAKYEELSDLKKLAKQWHKLSGLHTREEWSAAIVRAATAAEIAANYAIRREFTAKGKFSGSFVDSLMLWANGLNGKMSRLLVPLADDAAKQEEMRALKTLADEISRKRNCVVHQGEFCNEKEAEEFINRAHEFITRLVIIYKPAFELKRRRKS